MLLQDRRAQALGLWGLSCGGKRDGAASMHDILDQCNNPELLREIDAAVERYRAEHPRHVLDDVEADVAQDGPAVSPPAEAELLGRGQRVRPVVRYFPTTRRAASDSVHAVISMLHELYPN